MTKSVKVFSFGGGVQSHAVLVLQATKQLPDPYDYFVFSNVGHDSENPATIEYFENITVPYCEEFGINLIEVRKTTRGEPETLYEYIHRTERTIPIPARMSNGAPGNRSCTNDFKIRVVDKWIREQGYSHAIVGLGLSIDEFRRVRDEKWHKSNGIQKKRHHPLIDMRISRLDCLSIIKEAGLPQPPKSACWFCPFKSRGEWVVMKKEQPELFQQAIELEQHINEKRDALGRDYVYLFPQTKGQMVKLESAVGDQDNFFDLVDEDDNCDSGYCFT